MVSFLKKECTCPLSVWIVDVTYCRILIIILSLRRASKILALAVKISKQAWYYFARLFVSLRGASKILALAVEISKQAWYYFARLFVSLHPK